MNNHHSEMVNIQQEPTNSLMLLKSHQSTEIHGMIVNIQKRWSAEVLWFPAWTHWLHPPKTQAYGLVLRNVSKEEMLCMPYFI